VVVAGIAALEAATIIVDNIVLQNALFLVEAEVVSVIVLIAVLATHVEIVLVVHRTAKAMEDSPQKAILLYLLI
jgi:hypothetical protein